MRNTVTRMTVAVLGLGLVGTSLCGGRCLAQAPPPQNGAVYHIFARSFCDSDGDGIGDLKGVIKKLDYLNDGKPATDTDLEVGILWLMPVFPSPSYHGYDVTDYRDINPKLGTLNDLKDLLRAAHARGLRVILDVPFNHTSDQHPWFKAAIASAQDPARAWYHIYEDDGSYPEKGWHTRVDGSGKRIKYFGAFAYDMPDLNFDSPAVRQAVKDIAAFWLNLEPGLGVDGFRLDAAKHIYAWRNAPTEDEILANNKWWREFSDSVCGVRKDAVLVGEVLGDRELLRRHAYGLDGLIDEPFMSAARAFLIKPYPGFVGGFKSFLEEAQKVNPKAPPPYSSFVYLSSHDKNPRLASELEKAAPGTAEARYRLGLCLLMSIGRHPILYYGDEIMQRGWKWNGNGSQTENPGDGTGVYDETLREPLPWSADNQGQGQTRWQPDSLQGFLPKFDRPSDGVSVEEEDSDPDSVLNLTRALTNLRTKLVALSEGEIGRVLTDSEQWLVFERAGQQPGGGKATCLVLINPTPNGNEYRFQPGWYTEYQGAQLLFWSDGQGRKWADLTAQNQTIENSVFVGPFGMVVLRLK